MDPVTAIVVEKGMAKLVDFVFNAALVGLERAPLVALVREREEAGATADEITDELIAMRKQADADAQAEIDAAAARGE